ncbi:MAG: hypothetical protein HY885_06370 [Deltaproteobacteria bacterium]|nr:hypothetical protein [Deltaproteobacteria bacterium]
MEEHTDDAITMFRNVVVVVQIPGKEGNKKQHCQAQRKQMRTTPHNPSL